VDQESGEDKDLYGKEFAMDRCREVLDCYEQAIDGYP